MKGNIKLTTEEFSVLISNQVQSNVKVTNVYYWDSRNEVTIDFESYKPPTLTAKEPNPDANKPDVTTDNSIPF
jgi:hypothetical protein